MERGNGFFMHWFKEESENVFISAVFISFSNSHKCAL